MPDVEKFSNAWWLKETDELDDLDLAHRLESIARVEFGSSPTPDVLDLVRDTAIARILILLTNQKQPRGEQ